MRKALTAGWRQFSYFSLFEDCLYVATFLKSTQPMSPLCFWQCFFRMALQWRSRTKKRDKELTHSSQRRTRGCSLAPWRNDDRADFVRSASFHRTRVQAYWQCISTCGIITIKVGVNSVLRSASWPELNLRQHFKPPRPSSSWNCSRSSWATHITKIQCRENIS